VLGEGLRKPAPRHSWLWQSSSTLGKAGSRTLTDARSGERSAALPSPSTARLYLYREWKLRAIARGGGFLGQHLQKQRCSACLGSLTHGVHRGSSMHRQRSTSARTHPLALIRARRQDTRARAHTHTLAGGGQEQNWAHEDELKRREHITAAQTRPRQHVQHAACTAAHTAAPL